MLDRNANYLSLWRDIFTEGAKIRGIYFYALKNILKINNAKKKYLNDMTAIINCMKYKSEYKGLLGLVRVSLLLKSKQ